MYDLGNMDSMEKRLIQKAYIKQAPINGSLELLPLCNMNCDMCYVRLSKAEMEQKGRLRTKEEWISLAHQMKDAGTVQSATSVQLQHCLKQETMMEYQNIFVNIQKNFIES